MAEHASAWSRLVFTSRDGLWAVAVGVVSVVYFLVRISLSTNVFFDVGGPTVSPVAVWVTVAVLVVQAGAIRWRTTNPVGAFVAVYLLYLVLVFVIVDPNFTVSATFLVAVFNLVGRTSMRTWGPILAVALLISLGCYVYLSAPEAGDVPAAVIVVVLLLRSTPPYAIGVLAGLLLASERRRAELADRASDALRQARDSQLAAAVAAERNAMARELHDVAAHHLSGILLQTRGAIRLHTKDADRTGELLDSVRSESEAALQNMRQIIGALRGNDEEHTIPGPTMSRLPDLLDSVRTMHPNLNLTVSGEIDDLSPATSLACYRIVQESLTNARKHAPGSDVAIHIRRSPRNLVIEVTNTTDTTETTVPTPAAPASTLSNGFAGFGLVGMRERATMLGGTFEAGPDPSGGWHTRATLPVERVVA